MPPPPGDFSTDFNADFSRVAYVAGLNAEINFSAELVAEHGTSATLAAEIIPVADIEAVGGNTLAAEIIPTADIEAAHGVSLALAAEIKPSGEILAALPVSGQLAAEISLAAEIVARQARRRPPRPVGGAGRIFPVPPLVEPPPPDIRPIKGRLYAELQLAAAIVATAERPPAPALIGAAPAPASGRLLAGLTVEATMTGEVAFVDGDDEELILLLAAA
jgi:hypothetical protein